MRLSRATLANVPADIARPDYDLDQLKTGIVHLGIGAFHRAHQAAMTDAVLAEDPSWGILGVSLRSAATRDALAPQDGLYTLGVLDESGAKLHIIGASTGQLVAPENPAAVLAALAAPETRIVSTTVTEKGYSHDPATGKLREDDGDILHDLAHLDAPRTTLGFLVAGLKLRHKAGLAPYTILACDNLPSNGKTLRGLVVRFAQLVDADFGKWVAEEVHFPSTMVDRIAPATTNADCEFVAARLGLADNWPVMTEPFCQWVIEDDFGSGRPAWEKAGAQFVKDVAPYELMKLRLLNGSHSTLAYLGYLMGHETVAAAMAEPALATLIADLMREESAPTLPDLAGFDVAAYQKSLLKRFRNPALKHRTWQIAMDGSQKLPQRLLGTIRDRLRAGLSIDRLALGVAAWMRYVTGVDENGQAIDVKDPMAARLRALADAAGLNAAKLAPALLSVKEIFGADLPASEVFTTTVEAQLDRLIKLGAKATVKSPAL